MTSQQKLLIAGVVMLIAAGLFISQTLMSHQPGVPSGAWYYDLNTNRLFPGPNKALSPIQAPSGPMDDGSNAGVRAYVFACSSCEQEGDRVIGYLEKYTPEGREQLLTLREQIDSLPDFDQARDLMQKYSGIEEQSVRLRRTNDEQWQPRVGDLRSGVIAEIRSRCNENEIVVECQPE